MHFHIFAAFQVFQSDPENWSNHLVRYEKVIPKLAVL